MTRITRVEVIDENGRSYVNWEEDNDITLSYQDDGRTLIKLAQEHFTDAL